MLRATWRELETELRDGLRHRQMAKAAGQQLLPGPTATAPALDPTCVQLRLACSAGVSPAKVKARNLVAWMARRKETESLKPIDTVIFGMMASHQAVAQANAEVAPQV